MKRASKQARPRRSGRVAAVLGDDALGTAVLFAPQLLLMAWSARAIRHV
jgi:hypothetical protein